MNLLPKVPRRRLDFFVQLIYLKNLHLTSAQCFVIIKLLKENPQFCYYSHKKVLIF